LKTWSDFQLDFPDSFIGEQYSTCPHCSPKRKKSRVKCLSANGDEQVFVCHHCGWSGSLKEGVDHKSDPFQWTKEKRRIPEYKPPSTLPAEIIEWFKDRGIPEHILTRNHIDYKSVYMPQDQDFVQAITFPFYRNKEVVNVKSRSLSKNFRLETNAERIFYGMDDITGDTAIIIEGEIDKLSLEVIQRKDCISVPDGAPAISAKDYTSKFSFLEGCEEWLSKIKTFILAVDGDEPGRKLEEELARRLGKHRCKRVQWPEGCKDANDVLVQKGANALLEVINSARDYPIDGIFKIADIEPQIDALYYRETPKGESTGWKTVDNYYTIKTGQVTITTGIPSHGKSEWVDALMMNMAIEHNWSFAVFSPENQPLEEHFAKLAEKFIGKPFHRGVHARMSKIELDEAKKYIQRWFTFILPPEDKLTVDGILELCKHEVLKDGIKGMVIDPWNEIDHRRPASMTETEYISYCLTKIRRFAREYGIHIWLIAHPAKPKRNDNGSYLIPTPYDISGSAHWRNKADNCITVFRHLEDDNSPVEIHIQKIRFKEIGKMGKIELRYDKITGRYAE
jgi:twinkle protein